MKKIFNSKKLKIIRQTLRNSATPQEIILWSKVRKSQLGYKFRRQHSIGSYIVDFYCPTKKLAIELDGSQHKQEKNKEYDADRSKNIESLGITILRFWNNDINKNIEGVIIKIKKYLN